MPVPAASATGAGVKRVILPAATPSTAFDAARRGRGRGHPERSGAWRSRRYWHGQPTRARQIDGRLKQNLAYSPPSHPLAHVPFTGRSGRLYGRDPGVTSRQKHAPGVSRIIPPVARTFWRLVVIVLLLAGAL